METKTIPRRLLNVRMVQNFHLVWLDQSINDDRRNSITKLRQIINTVNIFTDVDECIDFITDVNDHNIFMIVSQEFSQIILPIVQDISQVKCVYIFCANKIQYHEEWMKQWSKLKGVYADIASISAKLKLAAQNYDHNSTSISFVKTTDGASTQSFNTLDQSFMYTQILKETLLTIDFEPSHINDFLTYYRAELAGNTSELKNVDMIEKEYRHHEPIWWYTYPNFLYSMIDQALRLMEVELIIKMGFFIRDLHQHIARLHVEQFSDRSSSDSFTVYRGQGLSQTAFDQLKKTQGGLMSFNSFLSTSLDRAVSLVFAESNQYNSEIIGVLFEINIDPSIPSSAFANIKGVGYYREEEEILFSMYSVFRIEQVKEIDGNTRLWQVDLTLTSDNDPQLHDLTKSMQEEIGGSTEWHQLGELLIKLGHFNKAEELYNRLIEQTNDEDGKAYIFHQLGHIKNYQGHHIEAVKYYENALPANHPDFADTYNSIGLVYYNTGEYSKALSYFKKALEIRQKTLPANQSLLATSYNNIGAVYDNMGEYSKALSCYEEALEIRQKILSENHPDLATCYSNIGLVYNNMGEYSKALSYHEKAFEMRQKTLPVNHSHLVTSYSNIGGVYGNTGEYSKSLLYHEKALEIFQNMLPPNHPSLATSYNNVGVVYMNLEVYSKALSNYEKALEIFENTLPANHPNLATSYNNIGNVYGSMEEYPKALSYYDKALEIQSKILPPNHPSLATSYNNIGLVYYNMGEYSKALSYFEEALEMRQKSLPVNHPSLAPAYNNIGAVYDNMGEYLKALSYYECGLDILQSSLPTNHSHLKSVKQSMEVVKKKL